MSRSLVLLIGGAMALASNQALAENWFTWAPWRAHTAQNIRWPEQYLEADRVAVRAPFSAMIANGWRAQNTISTYHFNEETGELNDTGRLKVKAVMEASPEWRTLYVLRAERGEMTAARVRSVQDYAFELSQGEAVPPVLVTNVEPRGTRGDVANRVSQQFLENAPIPMLPDVSREDQN